MRSRPLDTAQVVAATSWWRWLVGAVAAFLGGVVVLIIDGDELTSTGWAIWLGCWMSALVAAMVSLVLGATRVRARLRG